VAHPAFKAGRAWQPHAWKVRLLRRSVARSLDPFSNRTADTGGALHGRRRPSYRSPSEAKRPCAPRTGASRRPVLVRSGHQISDDAGYRSARQRRGRPAIGEQGDCARQPRPSLGARGPGHRPGPGTGAMACPKARLCHARPDRRKERRCVPILRRVRLRLRTGPRLISPGRRGGRTRGNQCPNRGSDAGRQSLRSSAARAPLPPALPEPPRAQPGYASSDGASAGSWIRVSWRCAR
jgi:hypothetical protein